MGTRSAQVGRGLAQVEGGVGTLISFSTQPGNVALDGAGGNSPFARALVKHLSSSSDDVSAILIAVRNDVMVETQRKQVPWEHSALTGRFFFNASAQPYPALQQPPARLSEAAEAWDWAKDASTIAIFEAFIARYKGTFYAELASARLEELKKQQVAAAAPASVATASSVPNPRPPSGPARKTEGNSAWVKLCDDKSCLTHHERLDGDNGAVLVSAAIRQLQGRDQQHLLVILPPGTLQSAGVKVSIYPPELWPPAVAAPDTENRIYRLSLPFSHCYPSGCTAETLASTDTIEWMNRGAGLIVTAMNGNGTPMVLPVPLNGFAAAFTGKATDNRQYNEARKQLMEEIQRRAAGNMPRK